MLSGTFRWPHGTGQWSRSKVVIVSADDQRRERLVREWSAQHDVGVARTPLELILQLELEGPNISTVVVSDLVGSATAAQLAQFLDACYPWVRIIEAHEIEPALLESLAARAVL